jgi:adenine-specific DNA-methyltransferase
MAGSCSVASHLKQNYKIITNDIQYYSHVISKAIIENDNIFPTEQELDKLIKN